MSARKRSRRKVKKEGMTGGRTGRDKVTDKIDKGLVSGCKKARSK